MTETLLASPAPVAVIRGRAARRRPPLGLMAVSLGVALVFAAPLGYLFVGGIGSFDARWDALRNEHILDPTVRTLVLAFLVSGSCSIVGTALAWVVTRTDVPGRRVLRVLLALPLVIPSYVGAFSFVAAFGPGGWFEESWGVGSPERIQGLWPSVYVLTALSFPLVYLPVFARLLTLPASFEESARSLGCGSVKTFAVVVFPQIRAAISAGALLVFLYTVSEFGAVSILRYDTLTVRAYSSALAPDTSLAIASVLAVIALTVVIFERRASGRSRLFASVPSGRRSLQVPLRWWKVPVLVGVSIVVVLTLIMPIAVLIRWAFLVGGNNAGFTDLMTPARNTAVAGVIAAIVTVVIVLPTGYLTARYRGVSASTSNALIVAGFGIPGLVSALALVRWVRESPDVLFNALYQSFALLVIAYAIHFGAQALRTAQVAVAAVPRRLEDAARSLGSGPVRRFSRVDLPLTLPGLAAGGGLVMLSVMKELPATLLLAPTGFRTLATRIWSTSSEGFYARAGLASLVLVAVSAVFTWFLTIRRMEVAA